ncbi:MAG TPA: O-methyltransferase [Gemmatimonadaceae bacterium]|nr:O-methyltransferase [Gemmatimonadaceae bacterium]
MSQDTWSAVDNYIDDELALSDAILDAAIAANAAGGLPAIDVTASQGKLLQLLARLAGAKRILEIGTLGGYSTIWLARALPPDGRLITLEFEPKHAAVAKLNIERAGLSHIVEVRTGAALDSLPVIEAENAGPFDLFFIDADKVNNPVYLDWAIRLSRRGSVIIVDNVVREGGLADSNSDDAAIRASRKVVELIASDPRVDGTVIQTVGTKGYDGFAIAMVM